MCHERPRQEDEDNMVSPILDGSDALIAGCVRRRFLGPPRRPRFYRGPGGYRDVHARADSHVYARPDRNLHACADPHVPAQATDPHLHAQAADPHLHP